MHIEIPPRYGMVKAKLVLDETEINKTNSEVTSFVFNIFDATGTRIPIKIKIPRTDYGDKVADVSIEDIQAWRFPYIHKSE